MDAQEEKKARVQREDITYDSAWRGKRIHAIIWTPPADTPVHGVVQIAHGMVEYVARYDDFARFLAANGFVVAGNDHIGHGQSADSVEAIGLLPIDGADHMVNDVNVLRMIVQKRVPDVPYILFGHSMGSFIARAYLAKYGAGLAAAIICSTGEQPLATTAVGVWLAKRIAALKGWDHRSAILQNLGMGGYSKAVENPRTAFDWLNTDPAAVDAYIADPLCGAAFSAGGYVSLFGLVHTVATQECVDAVPAGLPVLFIAGAEDPVGDKGVGVYAAAAALEGKAKVRCIVYDGMRHEILNSPERATVYADVLSFLDDAIEGGEGDEEGEACEPADASVVPECDDAPDAPAALEPASADVGEPSAATSESEDQR